MEPHQDGIRQYVLRQRLGLVAVGVVLLILGTAVTVVQCAWDTNWPVASEESTVSISYCHLIQLPGVPPVCFWENYVIGWFAYYKEGPGYAEINVKNWRTLRWVLQHYDQGIFAYNSGTNGTLPFNLIFEDPDLFPYGLTTELVRFTDDSQLRWEVVAEWVDAYDGCPHSYYWVGDNSNALCLHGDDLSYDLGGYGGKGIFTARIAGTCGLQCPGSDQVILEWFVPPP